MAAGATYADDPIVSDPDPDPTQEDLDQSVEAELRQEEEAQAKEAEAQAKEETEQPTEEAEKPAEEAEQPPPKEEAPKPVAVQPRQLWHADPVVDASGAVVTPGQAPKPARAQVGDITPLTDAEAQEPGIDIQSNGYTQGRGGQIPTKVILHSTDGSYQGDVNTLTQSGKVGVHYYSTKDHGVLHFVNDADSAWHAGLTKYGDSGNPFTIGIEQEHVDGQEPWNDNVVRGTARTVAAVLKRYPNLTIDDVIGHSDLAGERKQDPVDYPWDKFRSYVNAYLGAPGTLPAQTVAQQGPAQSWQLDPVVDAQGNVTMPGAAPAPKAVSVEAGKVVVQAKPGFYQDEDPNTWATGTATKFGYNDPNDPGVGSTWTGKLNTNNTYLYGVAIPQSVLEAQFGHNYAAMRRARVDIVNPQTGERMRVPIVDVGPGADALNNGVITDFTEATNRALGNKDGTQYALNIVPNAGPDVLKNPQNFWDEQDALAHGINTAGVHKSVVAQGGGPYWQTDPLVPAPLVTAADQARTYQNESQIGALTSLAQSTTNLPDLYKRLDQPIPGTKDPSTGQTVGMVSDPIRQAFQQNLKAQLTQEARAQYGITDPNAAFAKAMTEPGFGDYAAEFGKKVVGNLQQAFSVLGVANVDQQRLNQAVGEMAPDASQDQRNALANDLVHADPQTRSNIIAAYLPYTSTVDTTELVPSIERLADPDLQAAKAADQAQIKASMAANMATDLRVSGKTATWVLDNLAQVPANLLTGAVPPWMFSQIYQQSLAEQQAQHPELDPSTQEANAAKSAMINTFGQELGNRLLLGGGGFLLNGLKASWQRALGQVAINTAGQAAIAGGSQALTNLATGEPLTQNVLQSTGAGAIVGGTFGAAHAAGELAHPALGETKTPERAQATTGPTGARVRGPTEATLETGAQEAAAAPEAPPAVQPPVAPQEVPVRPVSAAEVLGEQSEPITDEQTQDVLNVVAHNVFPDLSESQARALADRVALLGARNLETERFRYQLQQFLPSDAPAQFGPLSQLMSAYRRFTQGPTQYTAKEMAMAEKAYNEARGEGPGVPVPGALQLPIMWREVGPLRGGEEIAPQSAPERAPPPPVPPSVAPSEPFVPSKQYQPVPDWAAVPPGGEYRVNMATGAREARWDEPPGPESVFDQRSGSFQAPIEQPVRPPPVERAPTTEDEPWVSTIANRFVGPRVAAGEVGEVAPGQGYSTQELVDRGLRMKPEEVTQHISDVMGNRGGDPIRQAAAIRAEEARLSQRSAQASRIAEAKPWDRQAQTEANNAFADLTDFHNGPVATLKKNWHAQGIAMQGEVGIDLSTFNGIREKWLRDTGAAPPARLEPALQARADRVRQAESDLSEATNKLGAAIAQTKGKVPTEDAIRRNIMERLKVDPCIIP